MRTLLMALVLLGCKSKSEKEEAAWHAEFDALSQRYLALSPGAPEVPPEKVKGRRTLIVPRLFGTADPHLDEARNAAEAGLIVTWSVKSDDVPSRTYEQGIKGYGGKVQLVAWAHPEGKRVAAESWHCNPPSTIMRMTSLGSGVSDNYAEHCYPSDSSIRELAAALVAGRAPEGSNATDETKKAFDVLAADYTKRLHQPVKPLDVRGKKLLLYWADDGAAPQLYHNEYLLPASAYAATPAEVGVFGLVRATHDARPSQHYSNGAEGFSGKAEVILFAHPSGQLLSRTDVPCHLASEDIVVNVLMTTKPQRCSGEGSQVRAAIEKLLGPLSK